MYKAFFFFISIVWWDADKTFESGESVEFEPVSVHFTLVCLFGSISNEDCECWGFADIGVKSCFLSISNVLFDCRIINTHPHEKSAFGISLGAAFGEF